LESRNLREDVGIVSEDEEGTLLWPTLEGLSSVDIINVVGSFSDGNGYFVFRKEHGGYQVWHYIIGTYRTTITMRKIVDWGILTCVIKIGLLVTAIHVAVYFSGDFLYAAELSLP
jgi:hypothetical protein